MIDTIKAYKKHREQLRNVKNEEGLEVKCPVCSHKVTARAVYNRGIFVCDYCAAIVDYGDGEMPLRVIDYSELLRMARTKPKVVLRVIDCKRATEYRLNVERNKK